MPLGLSMYLERPVDPSMGQIQFNSNIHIDSLMLILILSYLPLVSSLQDFDYIKGIMLMLCVLLVLIISSCLILLPYFFCMYDKLRFPMASSVQVRQK